MAKRFVITGTASTAGAVAGVEKVAAALDKMANKANKAGAAGKKAGMGIEAMHGSTMAATGVLIGGVMAMDKIVMGGARYQALMQNLPFSIDAASKATKGFISQTKLAENALLASRAGVATNSKEYAELSEAVMKVAMSMGKDVNLAMTELTGALAKNETELLDNYGIILKVNQAQELYAKKLGKAKLSTEEAAEAFAKIGLDKIKEAADKATIELDDFTAGWLKFKTVITDVPRMVNAARQAIDDSAESMQHWFDAATGGAAMSMDRQTGLLASIGRRRGGGKGLLRKSVDSAMVDALSDAGGSAKLIGEIAARQEEYMLNVANQGHEAMMSAMKSGFEAQFSGKGKKGGKKDFKWSAELQNQIRLAQFGDAMNRDKFAFDMALGGIGKPGQIGDLPFERSSADERKEAFDKQVEQMRSIADMEAEMVAVRSELRELDPWLNRDEVLLNIENETAAKMRLLDTEQQYASEYLQGQAKIQEIDRINAERKKVFHEQEVARTRQDIAVTKQRTGMITGMAGAQLDVFQQISTGAAMAAMNGEKFGAKQVRDMAGQMAIQAGLMGAFELIRMGIAIASFNYVAAAQHQSNAAASFAFAGTAGAIAGVAAAGVGRGGGSRSGGGTARPSGSGGNGFRSGSSNGFGQVVPISRRPGTGPSAPPPSASTGAQSGGVVVHINEGAFKSLAPADADDFVFALRKGLNRSANVKGRL